MPRAQTTCANLLQGNVYKAQVLFLISSEQSLSANLGHALWCRTRDLHISEVFEFQDDTAAVVAGTLLRMES